MSGPPPDPNLSFLKLQTPRELAAFLEVRYYQHIVYNIYKIPEDRRYTAFEINKRDGGTRTIDAPRSSLKIIQKKIAKILQTLYEPRSSVHGYVHDRSIVTNARPHRRARCILNVDLKNFFGSINFGRVRGMFKSPPFEFPDPLATVLAQICSHKNALPLGAPTSPIIANIICYRLDRQMQKLATTNGCQYTRYADDITISTRRARFPDIIAILDSTFSPQIGDAILQIIDENGFKVNQNKTKFMGNRVRQEVTGVVVNEFPNLRRTYVRRIRAMIHAWEKFGHERAQEEYRAKFDSKSRFPGKNLPEYEEVLRDHIGFFKSVKSATDSVYLNTVKRFNKVAKRPIVAHDIDSILKREVWVIEDADKIIQGTGFFLQEWGFVTCAHCVGDKPFVYNPGNPSKKFDAVVIAKNEVLDLAILKIKECESWPSSMTVNLTAEPEVRDTVVLVGYPGYAPGKSISIKEGHITSFWMKSGVKRFNISAGIVAGNSGGPVLDKQNYVIGVAVTGADREENVDDTHDHGVIPVGALSHLVKAF